MTTLDVRVQALPPADQSLISAYVEFLEWRAKLPRCGRNAAPDSRALGARLREVRETLRQSQDEAAHIAGVALTTYEKYERGVIGRWATAKMLDYCEAWNVSIDWLYAGTGEMFVGRRRPKCADTNRPTSEPNSNVVTFKTRVRSEGGAA